MFGDYATHRHVATICSKCQVLSTTIRLQGANGGRLKFYWKKCICHFTSCVRSIT